MRHGTALTTLFLLAACSVDTPSAPGTPRDIAPHAVELPNSSDYTVHDVGAEVGHQYPTELRDVNDLNQAVGFAGTHAVYAVRGTTLWQLIELLDRRPPGVQVEYVANAINMKGAVVGTRTEAGVTYPVYWTRLSATGKDYGFEGALYDINDLGEAVGNRGGVNTLPMFWALGAGRAPVMLPLPRGATWGIARSITNNRDIVGDSDAGGVLWQWTGIDFVPTSIPKYRPVSIGASLRAVGDSAWGDPFYAGAFPFLATSINRDGLLVSGFDGVEAFVGDLPGRVTGLPLPPAFQWGRALAVNNCGLAVGRATSTSPSFPSTIPWSAMIWDPGC